MTELQIGLIGLGAAAVVGVFGFNKWQEFRHRKLAEDVMQHGHDDVLLGGVPEMAPRAAVERAAEPVRSEPEWRPAPPPAEPVERREPVFAGEVAVVPEITEPVLTDVVAQVEPAVVPAPVAAAPAPAAPAVPPSAPVSPPAVQAPVAASPVVAAPAAPSAAEAAASHGEPPAALLDPRIELVASMELVEPVSAGLVQQSQRDVLQRISRPIHWVAFNEQHREWERLKPESAIELRSLRVGLQLVNRLGPVTDADLALFVGAMQALADELMAVVDMPPIRVQEQAAELDRFSAEVDLEIGINLVSKGVPFSGTKIRALAEAAGMVLGVDGLFTRYDDVGRPQFSLQNMESTQFSAETVRAMTTHGLTFLLDVPRVDHGERVFMQMIELCKRFAETLQGVLVDDNRVPLGDAQIDHIRREFVGRPQATMAEYRLPAGSPQALRLFS